MRILAIVIVDGSGVGSSLENVRHLGLKLGARTKQQTVEFGE
jgi:hypothetical protein